MDLEKKKRHRIPINRGGEPEDPALPADEGKTEAHPEPSRPSQRVVDQVSSSVPESEIDWRERALRLQAEMENFRRRQQRRAEERVEEEKAQLLREFVAIMDDLRDALTRVQRDDPLYRGVQVTYDAMENLLKREGVERIRALGEPFDPTVHEAVAVVPASSGQNIDLLVVDEQQAGYRRANTLLRPARVIVGRK